MKFFDESHEFTVEDLTKATELAKGKNVLVMYKTNAGSLTDLPASDLTPHIAAVRAAAESLIRDEHNPVEP